MSIRAFFVSILACVLYSSCNVNFSIYPPDNGAAQYVEERTPGEFIGISASGWVAIFTGVLTLATIGLYVVNKGSLKQTTRSIDAYVNNERGIMSCIRSQIVPFMGLRPLYTYVNIGKSAVIIESWAQEPQFVQNEVDATEPVFRDIRSANILIVPNGRFSNGSHPDFIQLGAERIENFPWNDMLKVPASGGPSIVMHYRMIYYCPAFDKRRISRYTVFHRDQQMAGIPIGPGTLTFDRTVHGI